MSLLEESKYLIPSSSYGEVHNYEFFIKELKSHVRASESSSRIGLAIGNKITYVNNALEADLIIEEYLEQLVSSISLVATPKPIPQPKTTKKRKK